MGVYNTLRAAGPAHQPPRWLRAPGGLAGGGGPPADARRLQRVEGAVEALGNTLRVELRATGAKVGVAYFAELDTDMTSRGFGTEAASKVAAAQAHAGRAARGRDRRPRAGHRPALAAGRGAVVGRRACCPCGWPSSPSSTGSPSAAWPRRSRPPAPRTRRSRRRSRSARRERRPHRAGRAPATSASSRGRSAASPAGSAGTSPPNLFLTLGRHRKLFRGWLRFAGRLMPGGKLPRRETELVILRVAHLRSCQYEFDHHVHLGRRAGLGRRRHRAGGRGARRRWLVAARAHPAHGRRPAAPRPGPRRRHLVVAARPPGRARVDRAVHARRPLRDARHGDRRRSGSSPTAPRAA